MELSVAPMEGLTGFVWRNLHRTFFGGADFYYLPFISPTAEPAFTERQMRDLIRVPEKYRSEEVPQLLTKRSDDFIWAAKTLEDMGYPEVNLNLGCPAGTVVAKGKGSGFLRFPAELEHFLETIFSAPISIPISVKTRVGWSSAEEFAALLEIYARFPMKKLIVHPRLKTDQYKGCPRMEAFDAAYALMPDKVEFNGDIVTEDDFASLKKQYPALRSAMVGRALMADPALFRKAKGGDAATLEEIRAFSAALFDGYTEAFESRKNALMRLKECWFYQLNLFDADERVQKALFKTKTPEDFEAVLEDVYASPFRPQAKHGWFKPLN